MPYGLSAVPVAAAGGGEGGGRGAAGGGSSQAFDAMCQRLGEAVMRAEVAGAPAPVIEAPNCRLHPALAWVEGKGGGPDLSHFTLQHGEWVLRWVGEHEMWQYYGRQGCENQWDQLAKHFCAEFNIQKDGKALRGFFNRQLLEKYEEMTGPHGMSSGMRLEDYVPLVNGKPDPVKLEFLYLLNHVCKEWKENVDQVLDGREEARESKKAHTQKKRATAKEVAATMATLSHVGEIVPIVDGQKDKEWAATDRRIPNCSSAAACAGGGALTEPPIPNTIHIPSLAGGSNRQQEEEKRQQGQQPPPLGPSTAPSSARAHGRSHHVEAVQAFNTTIELVHKLIGVGQQIVEGSNDLKERVDRLQAREDMALAVAASQQPRWKQAAGKQQHDKEE
jgi:hypothetical protein